MSAKGYGCNNRAELEVTARVQLGWSSTETSRLPRMGDVPDPMSKGCQYQKLSKLDSGCKGCRWLEGGAAGSSEEAHKAKLLEGFRGIFAVPLEQ